MSAAQELDVRVIPPPQKHPTIHARLGELKVGESLTLVNDHDPRPLLLELEHDYPGRYAATYLERGPVTWRLEIKKTVA